MGFGDLKSTKGQQMLNDYLVDKSYIEGFVASQADSVVFKAIGSQPPQNLPHLLRWYNHIKSYGANKSSLPGVAKPLTSYGPSESAADDDSDDEEVDLFGDDDDEAMNKLKEQRIEAYNEKKAKKPKVIAKSSILLEVKPWDDETDMKEMEKHVRSIEMDGLKWCASKLVPVGYGIMKLQINCVVEDDKVSTDDLEEQITAKEDLVQSMDIVAFNKI